MEDRGPVFTVTRVQAIAYHARANGKKAGAVNFLVKLHGGNDDTTLVGLGEAQPRLGATGDRADVSWEFLGECLATLHARDFPAASTGAALAAVRELMAEFRVLADSYRDAGKIDWRSPFRGTLLGIETALLDFVARGFDVPLATLLDGKGSVDKVRTAPIPLRPQLTDEELAEKVRELAADAPVIRLYGADGVDENLALLERVATVAGADDIGHSGTPLWIDLRGRFSRQDAAEFVKAVVAAATAGKLPREVLIEGPVAPKDRDVLPILQRAADKAAGNSRVDVRIVADQSTWNVHSLGRRAQLLSKLGKLLRVPVPRAVFINPAQVGGLLGCVELVETVQRANQDVRIYLGGMLGATEVTAGTMRNLTIGVPGVELVAETTLANEPVVSVPSAAGIGVALAYEDIVGDATEFLSIPSEPVATHDGKPPNVYDAVTYLQPLGSNGTKGHLLEREALMLGMSTTRYNKGSFVASDGVNDALSFKWSRSPLSSAVSLALCTHKEATRMRLRRAGVPVPKGNTFAEGDFDGARAFVERIGYPVVVKPAMGVRGIGVVAGIRDDEALEAAFTHLAASALGQGDFIVEQHVEGKDYRIVVIGDEVIGAILREPGTVTGDGARSIAELMIAKNVARRGNPHLWGRPIKYDDAARFQLTRAGLTLDSVPERGQKVLLSGSCSLSQGGDSIDVLDELHPSIKEASIRAVKAVPGLAFCGVDFLLEDHTKPLDGQQAGICELNAHAAIGNCEYPLYGTPREVARTLMAECVRQFDLDVTERKEHLALRMVVRGRVTGVGYRLWLQRAAQQYGLAGWVRNMGPRMVEIVVEGGSEPVSALAALAVLGPKAAVPTDVTTTHIEAPGLTSFDIVTEAPKEYANAG